MTMRRSPSVHGTSFFFSGVRMSLRTFCQGMSPGHQSGFISSGEQEDTQQVILEKRRQTCFVQLCILFAVREGKTAMYVSL